MFFLWLQRLCTHTAGVLGECQCQARFLPRLYGQLSALHDCFDLLVMIL